MLLFSDVLYILVMYANPSGPVCLRCLMLTLSGPVELLFLRCLIAAWTCVVVSVMLVVCSLSVCYLIPTGRTFHKREIREYSSCSNGY